MNAYSQEEKRAAKEAELKEAKEKFDKFKQDVKEKLEKKKVRNCLRFTFIEGNR